MKPYLTDRPTVIQWAEDGDAEARDWLEHNQNAWAFGIDDGGIHAAFSSPVNAGVWLEAHLADHWHVADYAMDAT